MPAAVCGSLLLQLYQWISAARQTRSIIATSNSGIVLALAAAYSKTPALFPNSPKRDNPVDGDRLNGGTHPWWWSRCSLTSACPVWRVPCDPERRLAGRWNHFVANVHNFQPVLATVFPCIAYCTDLLLLIRKVQMPFSADIHSSRHHAIRGKLFPFNQQWMRFNVSFMSISPHTVILVTYRWIQTKEDVLGFTYP